MEVLIEEQLKEFIKRLPELTDTPPSAHYVMLAVRNRLARDFTNTKMKDIVVERKVIGSNKTWRRNYFDRVYNLAVLQHTGRYWADRDSRNDMLIPNQALAIFGTIIPRNTVKAASELIKDIAERLYQYNTNEDARYAISRTDLKFCNLVHANKSSHTPKFVSVDIDNALYYDDIYSCLSSFKKHMITQTSRGYHIILDISEEQAAKDFYQSGGVWARILEKYSKEVEIHQDGQEPLPGTYYHKSGETQPNYVTIIE